MLKISSAVMNRAVVFSSFLWFMEHSVCLKLLVFIFLSLPWFSGGLSIACIL